MSIPSFDTILAMVIVIFFAIGLHEYAHAKFADMAGDPTPRYYGRVTLNLFKHFDPLGTIMILVTMLAGIGIGWGKPVPMNPSKMRNPRWDHFMAVAAGPLTNLAQAVVWAMLLRAVIAFSLGIQSFVGELAMYGVLLNISLCLFNLIPIGPLDGHWLLGAFLPERQRIKWYQFNRQTGGMILLVVVLYGQFSGRSLLYPIIGPPMRFLFRILVGNQSPI